MLNYSMGFNKLMWFLLFESHDFIWSIFWEKIYPKIVSFAFLLSSLLGSPARHRPYLINLAAI